MNNDLDDIEEEIKEKDTEEKKVKHKVSGRSVFEIQEIIKKKSKRGENDHSTETVAGDKL